jgi:putative copper resistance protein D
MIETALALARWLQFAAAALLCGAPAFCLYALSPAAFVAERVWIRGVLVWAASVALIAAIFMLLAESAEMSGDLASAVDPGVIWSVASGTFFGAVWFVRLAFLAIFAVFVFRFEGGAIARVVLAILGCIIAASLAWQGHGGEGAGALGAWHRIADVVHLLAASIWIGALVVILRLLRREASAEASLDGLMRFSEIGPFVVAALILTGLVNAWALTAPRSLMQAIATPYAMVLAVKLVLFACMLGLAVVNRFTLTPKLAAALRGASDTPQAVAAARLSVAVETALAVLVLVAVAALGILEPPSAL